MATFAASSSTLPSISTPNSHWIPPSKSLPLPTAVHFRSHQLCISFNAVVLKSRNSRCSLRLRSAEQDTLIPEQEEPVATQEDAAAEQQTVSVPVSPSDTLTMYFDAEGTMSDAAIPAVTRALEGTEGVGGLKVQVLEGIASVQLTKQTTVQATGVASSLVELIQGSGFKLQTLNLSFEDEEDLVA
ncbi:unnamed protein product [Linum trigynum]|uniref:HMA domain-containing protein n=1 Tax=Linum trigynum TaxID=586398 RepID=A0AAV2F108_9ROSI